MSKLNKQLEQVCQRIAPAWPLKNFVAVNPYLGFSDTDFSVAAQLFAERRNIRLTMPISFYLDQIDRGLLLKEEVMQVLKKKSKSENSTREYMQSLKELSEEDRNFDENLNCVIDIASNLDQKDWSAFMVDEISSWASAYFDEAVSLWERNGKNESIYQSWKKEAALSRSPEIMGLKGFRNCIQALPDDSEEMIKYTLKHLGLEEAETEKYLHALLLKSIGWSSYISGLDFTAKVYQKNSHKLIDFLAILLAWEYYFLKGSNRKEIADKWYENQHKKTTVEPRKEEVLRAELVLQEAYDNACQRELKEKFEAHQAKVESERAKAQMIFCIDVRSERYRRNLEKIDSEIETVGFAGFFGFPINYKPVGQETGKDQCPVLLPSSVEVKEEFENEEKAKNRRFLKHQVEKTWKKFKSGAVTSFGFVSPLGIGFLPKILLNSFQLDRPVENPKYDGLKSLISQGRTLDLSGIPFEEKVKMAAGALTGMGIKDQLAPLVLITGHGSTSVNNPHASGLECGACGGHSGEINALTAQLIFNDPEVRTALKKEGIEIPEDTQFVGCLHDTTTDSISILNSKLLPKSHQILLDELAVSLEMASAETREERAPKLFLKSDKREKLKESFISRSKDWSQVRPEWGLAGCNSFVIAPRWRTKGMDLNGKAFLHTYDWQTDQEFQVLEAIMTAPMVVTSWINLQYFASTTDNQHFGAGNKTLHNVTAGVGVVEGSRGDLRIGLPIQSVHNGKEYVHLPQRLNVIIEAPLEAIDSILQKHENIKKLCDHSWIQLHRLDENGKLSHTYKKDLVWETDKKKQSVYEESYVKL